METSSTAELKKTIPPRKSYCRSSEREVVTIGRLVMKTALGRYALYVKYCVENFFPYVPSDIGIKPFDI